MLNLDLFIIELGRAHQPFDESFQQYHSWVTHSWVKSIWEKVDNYGYKVVLNNIDNPFPRVGDRWLMRVFEDLQYSPQELRQLNRVRLHQQVLFLSDILCVRGSKLDPRYKRRLRREDEKWSKFDFPIEEPSSKDFKVWQSALSQLAPGGLLSARVGNWVHIGHKLQPWRYSADSNRLFCYLGYERMEVYPLQEHSPRRYMKAGGEQAQVQYNIACTVEEIDTAVYRLVSQASIPGQSIPPTTLWEVLDQWGSMWMWEDLELTGSYEFLAEAIIDGSLVMCGGRILYQGDVSRYLFSCIHYGVF